MKHASIKYFETLKNGMQRPDSQTRCPSYRRKFDTNPEFLGEKLNSQVLKFSYSQVSVDLISDTLSKGLVDMVNTLNQQMAPRAFNNSNNADESMVYWRNILQDETETWQLVN